MALKIATHWTSDPYRIGRHDWRIGVGDFRLCDGSRSRCTFYEWRSLQSHVWNDAKLWPGYDFNGANLGLPRTLWRLHDREKRNTRYWLDQHAAPFRAELTPAGEQLVIPGCERNLAPGKMQLDLFG